MFYLTTRITRLSDCDGTHYIVHRHSIMTGVRPLRLLALCVAVNIKFLHALFQEGAGNIFVRLADKRNMKQTRSSLQTKIL